MKQLRPIFFTFSLSILVSFLSAQPFYQTLSIPVEKNGTLLKNAWSGGLDAPQFSPADIDGDGLDDLFVFDRNGNRSFVFINKGNSNYAYSAHYSAMFPPMENWALLRDFNKDGVPDIFCWANSGMQVYRGKKVNGILQFDLVTSLLSYTDFFSINYPKINLYVLTDDISGIVDVNGDGDLDVLVFGNLFNPSVPQYYENQSVEQGYGADSLIFDSYNLDECWGKFIESDFDNELFLGACKTGGMNHDNAGRHAGSTLCPFDMDGDGDMDLLLGDIGANNMTMLNNGGDRNDATIVSYDSLFPVYNKPIDMPEFAAAYLADIDNDGKNDLLVAPNATLEMRNVKNVMYYKNTGSNQNYIFSYKSDSFLVNTILDFGTDSKVAAFDYNNDGLMDLIVGNSHYFSKDSSSKTAQLALLENIGTKSQPKFRLVTNDYENIARFGLKKIHPAFGDLDGDGKPDMLLGDVEGQLYFFKNNGTAVADFSVLSQAPYFNIDESSQSTMFSDKNIQTAPFIFDVDGDGDNDIVCGRKDGKLNWYINFGSAQNPQFHQDSVVVAWGGVNLKSIYEIGGYSQPVLLKENGETFLYSGSNRATVFKFKIPGNDIRNEAFLLIDSNYLDASVGRRSTIAIADFNNDGKNDFVLGNSLGGLDFYSSMLMDANVSAKEIHQSTQYSWSISPNPASGYLIISTENKSLSNVEIFSITGNKILEKEFVGAMQINTDTLPQGMYFVHLHGSVKCLMIVK